MLKYLRNNERHLYSYIFYLAGFSDDIIVTNIMKGRYKDMKKLVIMIIASIMAIMATACGEETKETKKVSGVEEIQINEIQVEEIQVEEIQIESILTEKIYIDDEYEKEAGYNTRVNTWENSTTYCD